MRRMKQWLCGLLVFLLACFPLSGCSLGRGNAGRQILRVGHNQSINHPTHLGLLAFKAWIEEKLGEKYQVEIFPSELLGSQNEMVQLTQTGAITFVVASNALLESFSKNYSLFNLPYLFSSKEAYHEAMNDPEVYGPIFESTKQAGVQAVTWLDAGARSFYTMSRPIEKPADLKGLKIRVQQSATNVRMMELLGGTATPMGFGEVYTALQAKILDGAENNEMALTDNGHGDICKFYSYDMHQMIPDIFLVNRAFYESLSGEDKAVFDEGFRILNQKQCEAWEKAVAEAKKTAEEKQGVHFFYPDTKAFQEVLLPMHQSFLKQYPNLKPIYERLQYHNARAEKQAAESRKDAARETQTTSETKGSSDSETGAAEQSSTEGTESKRTLAHSEAERGATSALLTEKEAKQ